MKAAKFYWFVALSLLWTMLAQAQETPPTIVARTEQMLSGPDWRLGSFSMGTGERVRAFSPDFDIAAFRSACVPGEVQVQIGLKGMERYYQSRELSLINEKEWWYRKSFVPNPDMQGKRVCLRFEGADYFASAWLNGEKLGDHEGCMVPFEFDVTSKLLFNKENVLAVKVICPWVAPGRGFMEYMKGEWTMSNPWAHNMTLPIPGGVLGPYWDGIPAYGNAAFPMGLNRDVKLVASGAVSLEDVFVRTKSLNLDGSATLGLSAKVVNRSDQAVSAKLSWNIAPLTFQGDELLLPDKTVTIPPGENDYEAEYVVQKPQLWWTWDTGSQNLYHAVASIAGEAGSNRESREAVFGIRTIERKDDMSYWLNGRRLFLKGAWYPMSDYYVSQTTRDDYAKDLELFRAANLNHLISFTILEKPDFYDLCDRLGILVMFEYPFQQWGPREVLARDYPRRDIFVKESLRQLRRITMQLRNHPSLIVLAPFAEADEFPEDWKKFGYDEYLKQIEAMVRELAPGTIFHPSFCGMGEQHFWMGNAGMGTGHSYQEHFDAQAGFVSEYGSIAMPGYEALKKMLTAEEMWSDRNAAPPRPYDLPIDVPAYAYHTSFEYDGLAGVLYRVHQATDSHVQSIHELIEGSQLYQAFLIKYATECYRRKKYNPINGTRIWAYREVTPGIRFNFLEYDRLPKMAYYFLQEAQAPFAMNFAYREALESHPSGKTMNIPVWVVNDLPREVPADVSCKIFDLQGRELWSKDFAETVEADGGKEVGSVVWTTPDQSGIYVLRGKAIGRGAGSLVAESSCFIRVHAPSAKIFDHPFRVLLIGQKRYSDPISRWLASAGVDVDVIKEETIANFAQLKNPEELLAKYQVVWLASFDSLWKLMDDEMAEGLKCVIERGVGFIHTGGPGSFHGGMGRAGLVDARPLVEALPVKCRDRNDLVYDLSSGQRGGVRGVRLLAPSREGWSTVGLKEHGLAGFNQVEAKHGVRQIMTVCEYPLLVTGEYGKGKTAVFTGFTPADAELPPHFRAVFTQMLVEVSGKVSSSAAWMAAAQEKPLFEILSELPTTSLTLPEKLNIHMKGMRGETVLNLKNSERYARLVRIRVEWDLEDRPAPHVLFGRNYVDLLPQEEKQIVFEAISPEVQAGIVRGHLIVEGSNVAKKRIPIEVRGD